MYWKITFGTWHLLVSAFNFVVENFSLWSLCAEFILQCYFHIQCSVQYLCRVGVLPSHKIRFGVEDFQQDPTNFLGFISNDVSTSLLSSYYLVIVVCCHQRSCHHRSFALCTDTLTRTHTHKDKCFVWNFGLVCSRHIVVELNVELERGRELEANVAFASIFIS